MKIRLKKEQADPLTGSFGRGRFFLRTDLFRGTAEMPLERVGKCQLIVIADPLGNIPDPQISVAQQFSGSLHPQVEKVLSRRETELFPENPA